MWTTEIADDEGLTILSSLALSHCNEAGEHGMHLAQLIERGDWRGVCDFKVDYGVLSVSDALHIRQALGFFTKLEWLDLGVDREATAFRKFVWSEEKCRLTNERFRNIESGCVQSGAEYVLLTAQRKIAQILGPVPLLDDLKLYFGSGATVTIPRRKSCATVKLSAPLTCTASALPHLPEFFRSVPHISSSFGAVYNDGEWEGVRVPVQLYDGTLTFVAKNVDTYRSIVVPTLINGMVDGGIGLHMRQALRRSGIDLADQTLNQRLARRGSLTGALATLDQTSASDLIAHGLVAHLLPMGWYTLLRNWRTNAVTYKGQRIVLEKFSGMGCGFTFPLQSLIFWALAQGVRAEHLWKRGTIEDDTISVYGDDLIVPVELVPRLLEVYELCGFVTNEAKSYWTGGFRESCGTDWLHGINIRPFYQKDRLSPRTLYVLHNFYMRNYDTERAADVLRFIPEDLRVFGPDGYGDGHLIGDWRAFAERTENCLSHEWAGWTFSSYKLTGRKAPKKRRTMLYPLYSIYLAGFKQDLMPDVYRDLPIGLRNAFLGYTPVAQAKGKIGGATPPLPGWDGCKLIKIYTFESPN